MKNFLKNAGKETVIGIGMILLITIILVFQYVTVLEYHMVATVGFIVLGLRAIAVYEKVKSVEIRNKGVMDALASMKAKADIDRAGLENKMIANTVAEQEKDKDEPKEEDKK